MSGIQSPCYYAVTDAVDTPPVQSEIIEGRLFFDGDQLVCGAGEGVGGYGETIDEYSGSTVRRLLGGKYDPQQFDRETALDREGTIPLSIEDIEETALLRWNGSDLSGADRTYGVRVASPALPEDGIVVQLGKGHRNRGAGKERHRALADALDTEATQQDTEPAQREPADTTSDPPQQDQAETATQPQHDTDRTQRDDAPTDDPAEPDHETSETPPTTTADSNEPMVQERCPTCDAQIDRDVNFCPSCGTKSPLAEPDSTHTAGENTERSDSTPATDTASGTGVAAVAERVEQQTTSATARQLCRTLSDPAVSEAEVQSALEDAVEELESVTAVKEAVKPAKRRSTVEAFETIKRDLDRERSHLADAVEPLVDRLLSAKRDLDTQESQHGEMRAAVERICEHAASADEFSFRGRELHQQVEEFTTALENDELTIRAPKTSLSAVVEELDREIRASSGLARELLETIRRPTNETAAKATIRDSIEVLDEYAETREMLADISVDDVRMRLESLDRELRDHDTPTHSQLANRVRELEAMIDDADTVDDIQLFAIYQEISFYDRTLLPQLTRAPSGVGTAETDQLLESVRDRTDAIKNEYISVRADHNHSIPRHFLGLAEELTADAQQRTNAEQAEGMLLAADALLDHVEELYQRNEYSVMLRRLRG